MLGFMKVNSMAAVSRREVEGSTAQTPERSTGLVAPVTSHSRQCDVTPEWRLGSLGGRADVSRAVGRDLR